MTVTELRKALEVLEAQGHGNESVIVRTQVDTTEYWNEPIYDTLDVTEVYDTGTNEIRLNVERCYEEYEL